MDKQVYEIPGRLTNIARKGENKTCSELVPKKWRFWSDIILNICFKIFQAKQFLEAEAKKEMGTVCDMTLSNIVDLYLFDDQASVVYRKYPSNMMVKLDFKPEIHLCCSIDFIAQIGRIYQTSCIILQFPALNPVGYPVPRMRASKLIQLSAFEMWINKRKSEEFVWQR